jgi:hypothetical protein
MKKAIRMFAAMALVASVLLGGMAGSVAAASEQDQFGANLAESDARSLAGNLANTEQEAESEQDQNVVAVDGSGAIGYQNAENENEADTEQDADSEAESEVEQEVQNELEKEYDFEF